MSRSSGKNKYIETIHGEIFDITSAIVYFDRNRGEFFYGFWNNTDIIFSNQIRSQWIE